MAYYLVRAKPIAGKLDELKARLESGEIREMRPFGTALDESLRGAKRQGDGAWVWEEEDYCVPPLAMERAAVLDAYFTDLEVERLERGQGWKRIAGLPRIWELD